MILAAHSWRTIDFVEVITLSSMNEIRQVFSTSKLKARRQLEYMSANRTMYEMHSAMTLMGSWDANAAVITSLKSTLVTRMKTYVDLITNMPSNTNRRTFPPCPGPPSWCRSPSRPGSCTRASPRLSASHRPSSRAPSRRRPRACPRPPA
ncbi:hypothetical protein BDW62DRAFT_140421 [Aspergillus aurantiobrunneus]